MNNVKTIIMKLRIKGKKHLFFMSRDISERFYSRLETTESKYVTAKTFLHKLLEDTPFHQIGTSFTLVTFSRRGSKSFIQQDFEIKITLHAIFQIGTEDSEYCNLFYNFPDSVNEISRKN